jgi:hypothetical protein
MSSERVENTLNAINEEYEENIFRLAVKTIAAEIEGKSLDEELRSREERLLEEASVGMPDKDAVSGFSRRMNSYMKAAGKKKPGRPGRIFCMASAAAVALICVFSVATLTVDALRVKVLNLLISIEPEYTSIQLTDRQDGVEENGFTVNWSQTYVPSYIPEGFEVSNSSVTPGTKRMVFTDKQDESRYIIYSVFGSSSTVAIDTENAQINETIKIGGRDGMLVVKDLVTTLAWGADGFLIVIQGQIDKDEMFKIAESVVYQE